MARDDRLTRFEQMKSVAKRARLPYEKDMLLNMAFFLDHQHAEWVGDDWNGLRALPHDGTDKSPRPVSNKIMHFVSQEHAHAISNRPTIDVLPASATPTDVSTATVAKHWLRWLTDANVANLDGELADALWDALIMGEGYLKWVYDPGAERPDIIATSPLELFVDPYCKQFRNARYIIHEQFMDVEQVYDIYGIEVKADKISKQDQNKAALLAEIGQAPVLEGVVVNELWLKPGGKRFPNGIFCAWTSNQFLIEPSDYPYQHGQLPFTILGSIPRRGTPHYTCATKYLRAPQVELNQYHAQRLDIRKKFSNPKWLIDTQLELEADPDDSTDQILRGDTQGGTLVPMILQPSVFPDNGDGDWLTKEMMDVVGIHEVSQAQVPGRVEAAKAIELLKEADNSRLEELGRSVKEALAIGGWQALMLAKQFQTEEQIVQTYSREGMPEVRKFIAEDISPGMKVEVTMATGLGRSRAAREDKVLMMHQNGLIQSPETVAEMLDIPVGQIVPYRAQDITVARNENLTMKEGDAVTANSWDDHEIHIREHNNFRKTDEFWTLPEEVQAAFEFHVQQHEQLELEHLAREAEKQQIFAAALQPEAGGTPPGPGAPVDAEEPVV